MPIRARLAPTSHESAHFLPISTAARQQIPDSTISLLQRVDGKLGGLANRVVQFISAGPDDDTTAVASAYAQLSSERTSRAVLLVDDRGAGPGLLETVLEDRPLTEAAAARSFRLHGARLAGEGVPVARLADPSVWATLRQAYDEVVIDSGCAFTSRVALLSAPRADAVVLVVHAGRTRFEALRRLMQDLAEAHAPVFGAVLANRRNPVPAFLRHWL